MSHNCTRERQEHLSTQKSPFHFVDSGLSSVYLVGIRYFTCECGRVSAEIPAVKQLMKLIAREIVQKPKALVGEEIRFLRKRLGQKQTDFARRIGVEPETLSRYENDQIHASASVDKLIRLYYALASGDQSFNRQLKSELERVIPDYATTSVPKKVIAKVKESEWESQVA